MDYDYRQTSSAPRELETHGGDDTTIYARGPAAHLFHTTHEQTYIANVLAYAACVGNYQGVSEYDYWCMQREFWSLEQLLKFGAKI